MFKETLIHMDEENVVEKVAKAISAIPFHQDMIVVCVGTDRSTGDSLGPLVGMFLKEKNANYSVYGTIENPVHALNLEETIKIIKKNHPDSKIIAIDACLGNMKSVGKIKITKGALKPGAAVNKNLPPIGDYHISGIVNISGHMELAVIQNTRLSIVLKLAKIIAEGLMKAEKNTEVEIEKKFKLFHW